MQEQQLVVPRTARYYTLGTPSEKICRLWIVCHGYGQLARYFLRHFSILDDAETMIVAPEALSRFYLNGFSGRVGATWMTKEDRISEIEDQEAYLTLLQQTLLRQLPENVHITVLGFSQGCATVCRWLSSRQGICHRLILWAGAFPADIDFSASKEAFQTISTILVYGTQDEFITPESLKQQEAVLSQLGIAPTVITFDGKHAIDAETLKSLK
ncbi:alpha/beta hydrolase [Pontibacter sp. SGAir0037]|uniref:alpha/beta hydrolase n=1 Tax=Pontibacter sp. SGAir0037 TaxID=2571030 RepID=UPI0010CCE4E6|nr:phospholipase [Pontibacter sp. SGAir0037]QCR20930.1 phospholipase [Pontibacter sp. SGAir0037]